MFSREMEAKEDEVAACEGAKEGHKMVVHFILLFFLPIVPFFILL